MRDQRKNDGDLWLPAAPNLPSVSSLIADVDSDDGSTSNRPAEVPARISHDSLNEYGFEQTQSVTFVKPFSNFGMRLAVRLERPMDLLAAAIDRERESGVFFLWQPVFLALGCLLYFFLPREPLVAAFPILTLACAAAAWRMEKGRRLATLLWLIALVSLGASLSMLRVNMLDTQMLPRSIIATVYGTVEKVERRADGRVRYTLAIDPSFGSIDHKSARGFSGLVRVSERKGGENFRIGDKLQGKAKIGPPSGPAYPGGYSFSFNAWFQGIGGSGFFLGHPELISAHSDEESFSIGLSITKLRYSISDLIRSTVDGRAGGLAAALIVGDRSGIDEQTADTLRQSGLAHILAISGLHMALVAATVVASLRFVFAMLPSVTLLYPVHKWAAGGALLAVTFYLLLSGASVSTQRAYIMISVMLCAVLLDQRALTMRNVSLAAIVVIILSPEAVLLPGFQMSFAAVAALVATYEALTMRARKSNAYQNKVVHSRIRRFIIRDMGGLALTSIVAGLATGIFAAYHFHRVAPFGLLANLGAMPLVSIAVMPLALFSVLLMPFGLESIPLSLMAVAVEGVVTVAEKVSTLKPDGNTGILSKTALAFVVLGLMLLCLLKTRLRLIGLLCLGAGMLAQTQFTKPDVLILENGKQIGLLHADGSVQLLKPRAEKFSTRIWQRAYNPHLIENSPDTVSNTVPVIAKGLSCDAFGCAGTVKGWALAVPNSRIALAQDCYIADIIIVSFPVPAEGGLCRNVTKQDRPLIIHKAELHRKGTHSIELPLNEPHKLGNQIMPIVTTSLGTNPRPWTRHRYQ